MKEKIEIANIDEKRKGLVVKDVMKDLPKQI